MSIGISPETLSQAILVGIILVGDWAYRAIVYYGIIVWCC